LANNDIYKPLYNYRAQGVSGKNEQPTQAPWRGAPRRAGPIAAASVALALGRPWSRRPEAMLRLFIAEHCSTIWKHTTMWKRSSITVNHTKNEVSCSYAAQNIDWKKIVGRKVYWRRPAFSAHANWERAQDEKL